MALFSECMQKCARKVLDTADIVREGDFATVSPNDEVATGAFGRSSGDGGRLDWPTRPLLYYLGFTPGPSPAP